MRGAKTRIKAMEVGSSEAIENESCQGHLVRQIAASFHLRKTCGGFSKNAKWRSIAVAS